MPRDIGPDGNLEGHIDIAAYPLNPDAPGAWHMTADASTFTVHIVSEVPEPASFAMLGGGLLALAAWRRRRVER